TFVDGDCARLVTAGLAGNAVPRNLRCDAGLASAAFLFPVAHGATIRVAAPLTAERRTRRTRLTRRRVERMPELPATLPGAEAVARSWEALAKRGMRLELPPGRLARAVEANRRFLLLLHVGDDVTPGPYTSHH